jgi:hypothetical protein
MTKLGIQLDVESGGFISGIAASERSVESLTQAMKKAKAEGRDEDFVRLQIQRDTLAASTTGFKKDTEKLFSEPRLQTTTASGASVIKMDADQATVFKDLNSTIKKLTGVYVEQINNKDFQGAHETFSQLQQKQGEYKKAVDEATAPPMSRGAQDAIKAIGIGQLANAINDGFARWTGSLDRSGIINQYGSGDVMGGRLSERRRQADLWGGLAQAGLGVAGTAAGFFLGGAGGSLLGGTLGTAGGKAIDTVLHKGVNKEATESAYAGLWTQRSSDAMELAALMGNPNRVREAFKTAADAAAAFGYSAEEGMDTMKQAIRQGMNGDRAREVTEQVFQYERGTGADRGTLTSLSTMTARYGAGDALRAGWGGLGASGMSSGQYNEYLRAIQRIMEDGISKGFVRSSDQVAQSLTMLAQMTGNNPLWQGENGAKSLQEMNTGLESTTGLRSTSDIVAFRAAQNIARRNGQGGSYIDSMKILEGGLTPGLFNEYMELTKNIEGGNKEAIVERMRQTFGLNYTKADALYEGWNPAMDESSLQALIDRYKNQPLPNAGSPELGAAKTTQDITNWWTQTGQIYWDNKIPTTLAEELAKAIRENNKEAGGNTPVPFSLNDRESVRDVMGGFEDMTVFNERGMPVGSFRDKMEEANNAPPGSPLNQAYHGIQQHFSELTPEKIQTAQNLGYYQSMWREAQGDTMKMWDIIQRRGNANLIDRDTAVSGFFDRRGDTGIGKSLGSFLHVGDNDSTAMDNLRYLEDRTKIDSPDYSYLMRAYNQLTAFEVPQREEVDRNNSLNAILKDNELTAQKLYDAVVELSRIMGVRIVYE